MDKIARLLIVLVLMAMSYSVFGTNRDTSIHDTLLLSLDKIIKVTLNCNGPDELLRINSNSEFTKIFGSNCPLSPAIDFSTETLLYFPTKASGCKSPDYITTVKIANGTVIYHILIVQHGICKPLIINDNCIAIPKIYSNYSVDYMFDILIRNDTN